MIEPRRAETSPRAAQLIDRLASLADRYEVPGASLAVLSNGVVTEAAWGVLNNATGVETTTDSLFQLGSITKVYTATLIMMLVEEGRLALDEPVVSFLPEFAVSDAEVSRQVTLRHLLCHTSGIEEESIIDAGPGDDCLERYVRALAQIGQTHPLGATMSYSNAGYSLLGRVIEKVTGSVWDDALRSRLIKPLGLTHTVTLPEEALRFRTAIGHLSEPGCEAVPVLEWSLRRSGGPAGRVCARAADVITFARMHMDGGIGGDGSRLLSETSVAAMQERQVSVPEFWHLAGHWGLGWILFDWNGHDGSTTGQQAFLRVVPAAGVAIALLTNGGRARDLYWELYRELMADVADVQMPAGPRVPLHPAKVDLDSYTGSYEGPIYRIKIAAGDGVLIASVTSAGKTSQLTFTPVDAAEHLFVVRIPDAEVSVPAVFLTLGDGSRYLHFGGRAIPKVTL
jgi:CubicO group peptidase (beta-lactamase class C family)